MHHLMFLGSCAHRMYRRDDEYLHAKNTDSEQLNKICKHLNGFPSKSLFQPLHLSVLLCVLMCVTIQRFSMLTSPDALSVQCGIGRGEAKLYNTHISGASEAIQNWMRNI